MLILFLDKSKRGRSKILRPLAVVAREFRRSVSFVFCDGVKYLERVRTLGLMTNGEESLPQMVWVLLGRGRGGKESYLWRVNKFIPYRDEKQCILVPRGDKSIH